MALTLEALKILKKKKNLRLIDATNFAMKNLVKFSSANESTLTQSEDIEKFNIKNFKVVSKKKPSKSQIKKFNFCI